MATVGWSRIVTASSDEHVSVGWGGGGGRGGGELSISLRHTFVLLAWVLQGSSLPPRSALPLLLVVVVLFSL